LKAELQANAFIFEREKTIIMGWYDEKKNSF
jgi:hypothetical protein